MLLEEALSVALIRNIFWQLAKSVHSFHLQFEMGLMNIHPKKVRMTDNMKPFLYDFSFSQPLQVQLKKPIQKVSEKYYCAPEFLSASASISPNE